MLFGKPFYYSEEARKKKHKLLRALKRRKPCFGAYVLAIPENPDNVLEIISFNVFLQPHFKDIPTKVIGVACDKDEACELSLSIIQEVYDKTGGFKVGDYCTFSK